MRIRNYMLIAAIVATTSVACGNGGSANTSSGSDSKPEAAGPDLSGEEFTDLTADDPAEVVARDNTFVDEYIEVKAGTKVTWTNRGRTEHNVIPVEAGSFTEIPTDELEPKASASVTFTTPGDYAYYCSLHGTKTKGMVGAVRVIG